MHVNIACLVQFIVKHSETELLAGNNNNDEIKGGICGLLCEKDKHDLYIIAVLTHIYTPNMFWKFRPIIPDN